MKINRLYYDDYTENKVKNINEDTNIANFLKKHNSYEFHYFLSPLRHNLFNWYPFKKDSNLLEVGSGYGQLTSFFTKNVNNVFAIEDDESKAKIISNRVKDAKVIVCDLDKININEKFDYIILCNIFEYAKSFYESENPYVDYLNYLKTFLKDDGVILIAISNRLGLKYFSGFKEEHTGHFFDGINGYSNVDYIKNFSKSELINLINLSNFDNFKFFYPYPNHEFPNIIHTDKFVNKLPYYQPNDYFDERIDFIREDKLNQIYAKDNLADYFSNSFLVEIRNSNKNHASDDIDIVKLDFDTKDKFQTISKVSNDKVTKTFLFKNENDYIIKLNENKGLSFGKIQFIPFEVNGNRIVYNFYEESLESILIQCIFENDKNRFLEIIARYYKALIYNAIKSEEYWTNNFKSIFRIKSKNEFYIYDKSNLDLTFDKVFLKNDNFFTTGHDLLYDFPIPLEFIFYRVITHHFDNNILFKEFITIKDIFDYLNLDISNIKLFKGWNNHFSNYISKNIIKPEHKIITNENIDYPEKVEEYIQINYNSDIINQSKSDKLKRDIVLNQRKIINQKNDIIQKKNKELKKKNKQLKKKNKEFKSLLNSSSWKITKPLRKLKRLLK